MNQNPDAGLHLLRYSSASRLLSDIRSISHFPIARARFCSGRSLAIFPELERYRILSFDVLFDSEKAKSCPKALTELSKHSDSVFIHNWIAGLTSRKERILTGSHLDVHVQGSGRAINPLEAMMPLLEERRRATKGPEERALLYVTDSVSDSPEFLAFALKMAERHGANLELLQVVDPGQASSNPDAHMSAQYSLETLARSLKALKKNAHALLLFGHPEAVISKRAADIKATVIAFPLDGSARDRSKKNLAHSLIQKCACPVLTFSLFSGVAMKTVPRRGAVHP